jgi:endonuclease III
MDGTLIKNSMLFQTEAKNLALNVAQIFKNFSEKVPIQAKGLLKLDSSGLKMMKQKIN